MKKFIETQGKFYKRPVQFAVEHLFAVFGNGEDMSLKGNLYSNYRGTEVFDFPPPEPFEHIYPWTDTEKHQPFRKYAGCIDNGFKEMAEYFISCIELSSDEASNIKDWKANIETVKDVLLGTPPIQPPFRDVNCVGEFLETLSGEVTNGTSGNSSVYEIKYFDVQWSDCPVEVEVEVRALWGARELGNDNYICKTDLDEELFEGYPRIYLWLKHKGVSEGEAVIINWWW